MYGACLHPHLSKRFLMYSAVTEIKEFTDPENCYQCDGGDHISFDYFMDYAEPYDLVRWLYGEISGNYPNLISHKFGNERTEAFAAFVRSMPSSPLEYNATNWREVAEENGFM